MYRSKAYIAWLRQADGEWMIQKPRGPFKTIEGAFTVQLKLSRPDRRKRDDHNFLKATMDWAQHAGIIRDDGNSLKSTTGWVEDCEAPMGARLIFTVR
jgi:Holliday junction resolvase RusA-like endonuclease